MAGLTCGGGLVKCLFMSSDSREEVVAGAPGSLTQVRFGARWCTNVMRLFEVDLYPLRILSFLLDIRGQTENV